MIGKISFVISVVLALAACKPDSGSSTQSLENFAAGKNLHRNECKAAPSHMAERLEYAKRIPTKFIGSSANANKAVLASAVAEALTALPVPLLKMFEAAGGEIAMDDDAIKNCSELGKKSSKATGGADNESCHLYSTRVSSNSPAIAVMIPSKVEIIKHDLVKAVSYAMSERISKFSLSEESPGFQVNGESNKAMKSIEATVTRAFLLDLVANRDSATYKALGDQYYFSVSDPAALKEFVNRSKVGDLIYGTADFSKYIKFETKFAYDSMTAWVLAHAMDSAYCNTFSAYDKAQAFRALNDKTMSESARNAALKNTRAVMRDFFPLTYDAFNTVEPKLLDFAEYIAGAYPYPEQSGFNLADPRFNESVYNRYKNVPARFREEHARANGYDANVVNAGADSAKSYDDAWLPYPYFRGKSVRTENEYYAHAKNVADAYYQNEKNLNAKIDSFVQERQDWETNPIGKVNAAKAMIQAQNAATVRTNNGEQTASSTTTTGIKVGGSTEQKTNGSVSVDATGVPSGSAGSNNTNTLDVGFNREKTTATSSKTATGETITTQSGTQAVTTAGVDVEVQAQQAYSVTYPRLWQQADSINKEAEQLGVSTRVRYPNAPVGWTPGGDKVMATPPPETKLPAGAVPPVKVGMADTFGAQSQDALAMGYGDQDFGGFQTAEPEQVAFATPTATPDYSAGPSDELLKTDEGTALGLR